MTSPLPLLKLTTKNTAPIDAVEQARGIPDDFRDTFSEAFGGVSVVFQTRYGKTSPVGLQRGVPQGSVSGPEAAKPAQEAVLRLRESSPAVYTSSHGVKVSAAGFVDNNGHYCRGAADVPVVTRELSVGGAVDGIAFQWDKCSVYASDWAAFASSAAGVTAGLSPAGIMVSGYNI